MNSHFNQFARRMWYRICVYAHSIAPLIIDHPYVARMREEHKDSEGFYNSSGLDIRILPTQNTRSIAICAVDFVTPSSLPDVMRKLQKIGFRGSKGSTSEPTNSLIGMRKSEYGGWYRLGSVSRNAQKGRLLSRSFVRSRSLPPFVSSAQVSLMTISSSLTAIVVCFQLQDNEKGYLDEILRKHLWTEYRPSADGVVSVVWPRFKKAELLQIRRSFFRQGIQRWMKSTFGGFVSAQFPNSLSCMEVMTISDSDSGNADQEYTETVVTRSSRDIWEGEHGKGWKFAELERRSEQHSTCDMSVFFASKEWLDTISFDSYGGRSDSAILASISFKLETLPALWACRNLIQLKKTQLTDLRDSRWLPIAAIGNRSGKREITRRWEQSINWLSLSNDLKKDISPIVQVEMPNLSLCFHGGERLNLGTQLIKQIKSDAIDLAKEFVFLEKLRREFDQDFATLQASILNNKLSNLTVGGLALAMLALFAAGLSLVVGWVGLEESQKTELLGLLEIIWPFG